ncbi:MAG: hypothetical protein U9R38_02630 [Candidatus Margulisiibacteriota bacterium]|nr:hypothetical protein [Candidatus Margulisiibacteriota bacterium]
MTRESELNLRALSYTRPNTTRAFLKGLARLDSLAIPVEGIVVPRALGETQNRGLFSRLGSVRSLVHLIDENGVLNLRAERAGLKHKLGYIDLTPNHKPFTLGDYQKVLEESYAVFEKEQSGELGNLFLFKILLRARIDLYRAGERRSARKLKGEAVGLTREMQRIKGHLAYVANNFPFGTAVERERAKQGVERTVELMGKKNNTAANSKLVSLTTNLERLLESQGRERLARTRRASDPGRLKLRYDRGMWRVRQEGYKRSRVSLLTKGDIDHGVSNAKLLSRIEHQIESISEEIVRNRMFIEELTYIRGHLPDNLDGLFEIYLTFTNYFNRHKEKACAEIEGAWQLAAIGTLQALNLAKGLMNLAIKDIKLRQANLEVQGKRLEGFYSHTEGRMAEIMVRFAESVARDLSAPQIFSGEAGLGNIDRRLGGFLGTFFRGEMREKWLKRAKSRVVGTKNALSGITELVRQKKEKMGEVVEKRNTYLARRDEFINFGGDLELFREEELAQVRQALAGINELNDGIEVALLKASRFILKMGLDYANRRDEAMCKTAYFNGYRFELHRFRLLGIDQVTIKGSRGENIGIALRGEAQAMGLRFQELA